MVTQGTLGIFRRIITSQQPPEIMGRTATGTRDSLAYHAWDNTYYVLTAITNTYHHDNDKDSIAGSIQSQETLPYDLDVCQLITTTGEKLCSWYLKFRGISRPLCTLEIDTKT